MFRKALVASNGRRVRPVPPNGGGFSLLAAPLPRKAQSAKSTPNAPVAQLDRALPSEGIGHTFESCRVRQLDQSVTCFWLTGLRLG
jgi:hypothetical protein